MPPTLGCQPEVRGYDLPAPTHRFQLVLDPWLGPADTDRYAALRADPPAGCVVREHDGRPGQLWLCCEREAAHRLEAIAAVVGEIRTRFGLADADDLGVEKLSEFAGDSEFSIDVIAQLALMAARRAQAIGIGVDDLVVFLRRASGTDPTGHA